ncbi:efflux RND transporter periplasmic adaptor subunit [Massilia sp. Se16.2.3]|uniref:efflux RND transporter periplasmic adaptor subunit n=1 Tax=Massilia sp. Se16.2.3 TaxID=2709303 RepID=UPI001E5090DA|nr:efflux RND transporter periplasmic adaptor subunit [Massilia sp. Se16.2.3]
MQLDPQDLRLAAAGAQASLRAAETNRDLASADFKRYQELRAKNFVSQSVLDSKRAALRAAQAEADAARAAYRGQSNQAGYASLVADIDGVVTGIDAEVGQVVNAGTPVVRVARTDEMEVVIGIPEDQVGGLRNVTAVLVRLWANGARRFPGRVREVSPVADPATRTYAARIAIPPRADVRPGMTATVQFASSSGGSGLRAPPDRAVPRKGCDERLGGGERRRAPGSGTGQCPGRRQRRAARRRRQGRPDRGHGRRQHAAQWPEGAHPQRRCRPPRRHRGGRHGWRGRGRGRKRGRK